MEGSGKMVVKNGLNNVNRKIDQRNEGSNGEILK